MRATREVVDLEVAGLPPRLDGGRPQSIHDAEWRATLARGALERFARDVVAHATQIKLGSVVRWGSGGATAFRAEFVSISVNYK
jgi:hypothetical protein